LAVFLTRFLTTFVVAFFARLVLLIVVVAVDLRFPAVLRVFADVFLSDCFTLTAAAAAAAAAAIRVDRRGGIHTMILFD
jgi:Na+/alanine symporter